MDKYPLIIKTLKLLSSTKYSDIFACDIIIVC